MENKPFSAEPPSGEPAPTLAELSLALNDLRDSLVNVSLFLQDLRFEGDQADRQQAQRLVNEVLERAGSLSR